MSDEMVQEKTETAVDAAPDGANAVGEPGGAPLAPVSSSVAAPAATDEPAPAQPVAPTAAVMMSLRIEEPRNDDGQHTGDESQESPHRVCGCCRH